MRKRLRAGISLVLFCFFVSGCGEGETDDPLFSSSLSIKNSEGEEQAEFLPEENILFSASLANLTETGQVMGFTYDPFFDIFVRDTDMGMLLWKRSDATGFVVLARTYIFNPNEEKTFDYSWDQVLFDETPLEPGSYSARAVFFPNGSDPELGAANGISTDELVFTVLEPPE